MEKLKKWLEAGATVVVVIVGLIVVLPIYFAVLVASFAFLGARYANNAMAFITAIATVGYLGYLARCGGDFGAYEWAALGIMIAMIVAVVVWDVAAWALWRWRPDWLDAILPDDVPSPPLPKKLEGWLDKLDQKAGTIIDIVLVAVLIITFVALPFIIGLEGLLMVLDFTLFLALILTVGALVWPVMVLIGWLPRCRKRKFDEFFCAATRNCEVVIFGKVLKDDQERKDETADAEP